MMELTMLLTFFLGLLHLLAGVCDADVGDDDLLNPTTFIYANPYPIVKPYDCRVIAALATKGQCMSYIGVEGTRSESLASCELYCWETFYANTWDCTAPAIDESNPDWNNTFTDQNLLLWTPGTCSCSNSTNNPTASVYGDGDYSTASIPEGVAAKVADRYPRDLTTYGYRIVPGYNNFLDPLPDWNFWSVEWPEVVGDSSLIGVFGVMNNDVNNNVLRVHEAWAGRDTRPVGERAAFHDDVVSFWRLSPLHRDLNTLKEVRFDTVIEPSLDNLAPWVYAVMGLDPEYPLLIRQDGGGVNEAECFRVILSEAKFAKRMQQAINEYVELAHRRIVAFFFMDGQKGSGFDFAIYFDGYDPDTVGDDTWNWN